MGKGDRNRSINNLFKEGYDSVFGKDHKPQKGRWVWNDRKCESNPSFYIPNTDPKFNMGLGCITHGTRHAEKLAKTRGLVPIGDAPAPDGRPKQSSKELDGILREGLKAVKQGRTIEGRPLQQAIKEMRRR